MHSPRKQTVVLVIHGHNDEQLCSTGRIIVHLTEGEPIFLEVVWITGRGGITHVRIFALILVYAEIEQFGRDWCIKHEIAMEEPA